MAYRTGKLSSFDPTTSTLDTFAIKQTVDTLLPNSLELADHMNHYFDAAIKLEQALLTYSGMNIVGYSSAATQIPNSNIFVSQSVTGATLTSASQTFQLRVPALFGSTPFANRTFALSVRADEVPASPSSVKGTYANTSPTSTNSWNNLINKNHYQCTVYPVSGNLYNVQVDTYSPIISTSASNAYTETFANLGQPWETYIGNTTPITLNDQLFFLDPNTYSSQYVGVNSSGIYSASNGFPQRPFVSNVPMASNWGGFSVEYSPKTHIGMSSTHSGAGYAGFAKLYSGAVQVGPDQSVEFKLTGFASDGTFYGVPFNAVGVMVRSFAFDYGYFSGYGLLFGDSPGSENTTANPANETAPRTAYIVRFNNGNLAPNTNIMSTTYVSSGIGSFPRASATIPGCTILAGPVTLNYSSSSNFITYKFGAVGNVISLTSSVSGAAFSNVLSYTDSSSGALGDGEPGFFSIAKQNAGDDTVNRWLFFDDVKFNSGVAFSTTNIKLNSFFSQVGGNSDTPVVTKYAVSSNSYNYLLKWNEPTSTIIDGHRTSPNLAWEFGNSYPVSPQVGRAFFQLDWDPVGYHSLDFSALMRTATGYDFTTDGLYLYCTLNMWKNNFLDAANYSGNSAFQFGFSPATSTAVLAGSTVDTTKIGYVTIPYNLSYLSFSSDKTNLSIRVPLSLIPVAYRTNVRTIYFKGSINTNGLDGVYVSDLRIAT